MILYLCKQTPNVQLLQIQLPVDATDIRLHTVTFLVLLNEILASNFDA
jgi:hypothetical protein